MLEPLCRSPNIFLLENSFSMSFPLLFDRRDDPSWCRERLGTPRPDTSKHVARIVLTRAIMNTSSQTSTSPTCVSRAFWESREREREWIRGGEGGERQGCAPRAQTRNSSEGKEEKRGEYEGEASRRRRRRRDFVFSSPFFLFLFFFFFLFFFSF